MAQKQTSINNSFMDSKLEKLEDNSIEDIYCKLNDKCDEILKKIKKRKEKIKQD